MKICVLGAAPSSHKLAPFGDTSWEIWACSPPNYQAPRVDAWFELHSVDRKMQLAANAPYIATLQQHPRVYIAQAHQALPNAFLYPKDDVMAAFHPYLDYFATSSLAWMMGFAIMHRPKMIGIWGVDMSAAEEYGYQRAGMHYMICKAREMGIDIYAPPESDILMPVPLYGYKEHTRMYWKHRTRRLELNERLHKTREHMARLEKEELIFQGALDDMNYMENTWLDDGRGFPPLGAIPGFKQNGEDESGASASSTEEPGGATAGDDTIGTGV